MDRAKNVQDTDYIGCLPRPYRATYARWRARMLSNVDNILASFASIGIESTMEQFRLTRRDIALLVRLHYFTDEEVEMYGLIEIERSVPV